MSDKENKQEYELVEVPTQMGLGIRTPEGKVISDSQLLVEIANKLSEVMKVMK